MYWMDIFILISSKNWIVYLKKTENKQKEAKDVSFKIQKHPFREVSKPKDLTLNLDAQLN